jgi:hypothetical protein
VTSHFYNWRRYIYFLSGRTKRCFAITDKRWRLLILYLRTRLHIFTNAGGRFGNVSAAKAGYLFSSHYGIQKRMYMRRRGGAGRTPLPRVILLLPLTDGSERERMERVATWLAVRGMRGAARGTRVLENDSSSIDGYRIRWRVSGLVATPRCISNNAYYAAALTPPVAAMPAPALLLHCIQNHARGGSAGVLLTEDDVASSILSIGVSAPR